MTSLPTSKIHNPKSAFALVELLAAVLVLLALLAGQADARAAKEFYVSTAGSDSGAGTLASPYRTIQKAADMATQAGDNVYVRSGTYRESVTISGTGTTTNPISFKPYNNERVTITGLRPPILGGA